MGLTSPILLNMARFISGEPEPTYKTLLKNNKISNTDVNENYVISVNTGGGDCLFHSISQLVDIKQEDLRKRVCDFYDNFKENTDLKLQYEAEKTEAIRFHLVNDPDKNKKNHHEEICKNGIWGSFTDCYIISVVLDIPIIFFNLIPSLGSPTYSIKEILGDRNNVSDEELVHLWYNGENHFQSMKLKKISNKPTIKPLAENPKYNFSFASEDTEFERLLTADPNGFMADIFYYKKKFGEDKVDSEINFKQGADDKMNIIILKVHGFKFYIQYLNDKEYVIVHDLRKKNKTEIHSKYAPDNIVAKFIETAATEAETEEEKKREADIRYYKDKFDNDVGYESDMILSGEQMIIIILNVYGMTFYIQYLYDGEGNVIVHDLKTGKKTTIVNDQIKVAEFIEFAAKEAAIATLLKQGVWKKNPPEDAADHIKSAFNSAIKRATKIVENEEIDRKAKRKANNDAAAKKKGTEPAKEKVGTEAVVVKEKEKKQRALAEEKKETRAVEEAAKEVAAITIEGNSATNKVLTTNKEVAAAKKAVIATSSNQTTKDGCELYVFSFPSSLKGGRKTKRKKRKSKRKFKSKKARLSRK